MLKFSYVSKLSLYRQRINRHNEIDGYFISKQYISVKEIDSKTWGLGIGDWGLGIGDWAQSPIPNPHQFTIQKNVYNCLKNFYSSYNYDSQTKTFSPGFYRKYPFTFLKVISRNDLYSAFLDKTSTQELEKFDCKHLYMREYLKRGWISEADFLREFTNVDSFIYRPVSWIEFIKAFQTIPSKDSSIEGILSKMGENIEKKKFNFKHYLELYKKNKREIIYKTLKYNKEI